MVLAPNDLFSWNNKYSKYTNIYIANTFTFIFYLCTLTHSVHAGILKPWRGRLPCPLVVFSSHHVSRLIPFLVQAQLTLLVPAFEVRSPLSSKWRPHSQGPRTLPHRGPRQLGQIAAKLLPVVKGTVWQILTGPNQVAPIDTSSWKYIYPS